MQSQNMRTDSNEAFAARLRALMEEKGLTQMQLANLIGVSQSRVSEWRGAKAIPQPRVAEALAHKLEVESQWLLSGRGIKNSTWMSQNQISEIQSSLKEPMPELINWRQRAEIAEQKLAEIKRVLSN